MRAAPDPEGEELAIVRDTLGRARERIETLQEMLDAAQTQARELTEVINTTLKATREYAADLGNARKKAARANTKALRAQLENELASVELGLVDTNDAMQKWARCTADS